MRYESELIYKIIYLSIYIHMYNKRIYLINFYKYIYTFTNLKIFIFIASYRIFTKYNVSKRITYIQNTYKYIYTKLYTFKMSLNTNF